VNSLFIIISCSTVLIKNCDECEIHIIKCTESQSNIIFVKMRTADCSILMVVEVDGKDIIK